MLAKNIGSMFFWKLLYFEVYGLVAQDLESILQQNSSICKCLGFTSIYKAYSIQHILRVVPSCTEFFMLLFLWDVSSKLLFSITAKPFFLTSLEVVDPLRLVFWICGEIVGSAFTRSEVTCYSCHLYFQAEMVSQGLPKGV